MHQNHEESHTQGKILECVVMIVCMFPYVYTHVSLCLNSYVLMLQCMCPHASMQVSLCLNMFVLMFECMCPHVSFFRSKSRSKRQATRHRWGQVRQQIPDTLAVLKINIDGKEGRKRFNFVKNVVKIFNEFIPPEELLFLDRCEQLERAIETVNLEIPVTDLFFDGQYHVSLCFDADVLMLFLHVSIRFCACVLMLTSLCPYVFCMCPYAFLHVSLCYFCMFPYASVHVSLCWHHCVLILSCQCPYVILHVFLCFFACVLISFRWCDQNRRVFSPNRTNSVRHAGDASGARVWKMDVVHEKKRVPGDFREPRKVPRTPPDFH